MQLCRDASSKRSISRRAFSSNKFARPVTARDGSEAAVTSKASIVKLASCRQKQKKINNFFDNLGNVFARPASRLTHKRHPASQVHFKNKYEQFLLKRSDKAKVLYWNNEATLHHLPKIVISADFVFNQDAFWETSTRNEDRQQETARTSQKVYSDLSQQNLVRDWKVIHKSCFVVWIIRRKNTWSKLQQLISNYSLAVHAVFYIKKKRNYTVDLSPIYEEMMRNRPKQPTPLAENLSNSLENDRHRAFADTLTIFQVVKLNLKDIATYSSFQGRVPVLVGVSAKVILLRVEGPPPGLECVSRFLSKARDQCIAQCEPTMKQRSARMRSLQSYFLSSIPNYLQQYIISAKRKDLQAATYNKKQQDFYYEDQQVSQRIQQMKRALITQLIQQQGRTYQFQGGNSIYNFVGEMFKRNYRILEENILAGMQAEKRQVKRCEGEWTQGEITLDLRVDYYEMYLN